MSELVSAPKKTQFVSIQSLRGFAATAVVLSHLQVRGDFYFPTLSFFPGWFQAGPFGVDLFFVISGFIILYVTPRDLNSWRRQAAFLLRRLARIYPAYWAVVIPMILLYLWKPALANAPLSTFHFLPQIYLLPSSSPPVLHGSWTLVFEIYFYFVVSFLFRRTGRLRLYFMVTWFLLVSSVNLFNPQGFTNLYLNLIFSPLNLEFIAGALLAIALQNGSIRINPLLAGGIVVACVLFVCRYCYYADMPIGRLFAYGIPAFLILWMVLQMEIQGGIRWMKAIAPVGDRSYSIYLLHTPLISAVFKIASQRFHISTPFELFVATLIALFCLALSVESYYRLVEKPSHNAARRLSKRIEPPS